MLLNMIRQFNWVDILVIIILLRTCYIAVKNGLLAEFFKTLGTISAIYLSMHYYTALSDFFIKRFNLSIEMIPLEFWDLLLFFILVILIYLFFVALRETFARFIKMEAAPQLNKWGGLVLGVARGFLLSSLILFMLFISNFSYLRYSTSDSYLSKRIFKLAPATYALLWNGFFSKFMTKERFNATINEVQSSGLPSH